MDQSKLEKLKEKIREQITDSKFELFELNNLKLGGSIGAVARAEEIDTLYRVLEMIAEAEKEND